MTGPVRQVAPPFDNDADAKRWLAGLPVCARCYHRIEFAPWVSFDYGTRHFHVACAQVTRAPTPPTAPPAP